MSSGCKFIHTNEQGQTSFCNEPKTFKKAHCKFHDHIIFNSDLWNLPFNMIKSHIIDDLYQWIIHHPRQFRPEYHKYLLNCGRNAVFSLLINPVEMNTHEVPIFKKRWPYNATLTVPIDTTPQNIFPHNLHPMTNKTMILVDDMPVLVDEPPIPMDEISSPINYILSDETPSDEEISIETNHTSNEIPIETNQTSNEIPIEPNQVPTKTKKRSKKTASETPEITTHRKPIDVVKYAGDYNLTLDADKFIVYMNREDKSIRVVGHYDFESMTSIPLTEKEKETALSREFIVDDFVAVKPA